MKECERTSPQPASAKVASTVDNPCEANTAMNITRPSDSSQRAARVMAASDRL
jgi:hypothetical protein